MRNQQKIDREMSRELIVKTALELIQNIMPTNIVENLERLGAEDESNENSDDLDEDRFFYRMISQNQEPTPDLAPKIEPVENDSLTYFEIVEQEMMQSLPITKETVGVCNSTEFCRYFK